MSKSRFFWIAIVVGLLIGVGATAAGFCVDSGFLGNLLASIAGVGFGIAVSILIVDRLIEADRKQQWRRVRNFTIGLSRPI